MNVKIPIYDLHKAFESRIRLAIMSALMVNDKLDFTSLRELLDTSDGNLATHIKKLDKEGFIGTEKLFVKNKPNTRYYATEEGEKAFKEHLAALERIIKSQKP